MKTVFIIAFYLFFLSLSCFSQNKQDYVWPMGLDWNGGIVLDFNSKPMSSYPRNGILSMRRTLGMVSDKNGKLLFYSNGWAVANKEHQIMTNGLGLNDNKYFQEFWRSDWVDGGSARQDIIVLPDPVDTMGYYIIHKPFEYNPDQDEKPRFTMETIRYTYVDMRLDGGLGDVTDKDVIFFNGQLQSDYLTAIATEDNTGWWIMTPARYDSLYYTWLLDGEGIELIDSQAIGPIAHLESFDFAGDARFSPDGTKYAYFNLYDGLSLFDFDRATGQLSNLKRLDWDPYNEFNIAGAIEFSPNSRYIYITDQVELHQVDTWENNLKDGLEFIAEWDGFIDLAATTFYAMSLAPDCKIYVRSGSSSSYFHTIHNPDEQGTACNFIQHDVLLPNISSAGAFPNVPRFRVDEAEKCDSTITMVNGVNVFWRRDLEVYPSPANEYITVKIPDQKTGTIHLKNMQGQVVWQQTQLSGQHVIEVCDFAPGLYSVEFLPEQNTERVVYTQKITVVE